MACVSLQANPCYLADTRKTGVVIMKNVFVIAFLRRAWGAVPASAVGVAAAAALQQADVDVVVLGGRVSL